VATSQHDASSHVFLHLPRCLPHYAERKFGALPPFRLLPLPQPLPIECRSVDDLEQLQQHIVHPHTQCLHCGISPIRGICFTCYHCSAAAQGRPYSISLCEACYRLRDQHHPPSHVFLVFRRALDRASPHQPVYTLEAEKQLMTQTQLQAQSGAARAEAAAAENVRESQSVSSSSSSSDMSDMDSSASSASSSQSSSSSHAYALVLPPMPLLYPQSMIGSFGFNTATELLFLALHLQYLGLLRTCGRYSTLKQSIEQPAGKH
jgi:hypothetical protein